MQEIKKWWKKVKLWDTIDYIVDNRWRNPKQYFETGIPVIDNFMITENTKNIDLNITKRFIDENAFENFIRKYWVEGDILVTLVWNGYWNIALFPKEKCVIIQNTIWLRCYSYVDKNYIFYFLKSHKNLITDLDRGAAQPSVKVWDVLNIEIHLPPPPTQQKIASVLSKYDDLIENNNKRIKVLEQSAQAMYEEWFVRYRFPGSESVEMVESGNEDFGRIPKGWEIVNLVDISDTQYWYAFKSKDFNEDWRWEKVIRIRNVKDWNSKTYSDQKVDEKYIINNWDVLVWMDWEFHVWKWVWWKALLVQRSVCFRKKIENISNYFLFLSLKPKIEYLNSIIVGTTVAHLSAKDINNIKVILPSEDIVKKSKAIFEKSYDLEITLRLENQKLRETRDLLIPRLVNGELDVESLDIK